MDSGAVLSRKCKTKTMGSKARKVGEVRLCPEGMATSFREG